MTLFWSKTARSSHSPFFRQVRVYICRSLVSAAERPARSAFWLCPFNFDFGRKSGGGLSRRDIGEGVDGDDNEAIVDKNIADRYNYK